MLAPRFADRRRPYCFSYQTVNCQGVFTLCSNGHPTNVQSRTPVAFLYFEQLKNMSMFAVGFIEQFARRLLVDSLVIALDKAAFEL